MSGLSAGELGALGDGAEHTAAAQCWRASCEGSLPWQVERIVAAREAQVAERIAQAIEAYDEPQVDEFARIAREIGGVS